ncbi:contact-dependent growth inhibition system immunity protein [Pseudomonas sp. S1_E04]
MKKQLPELQQFLAGYFHQDWVDEHKNADEVIKSFISETSTETIAKVKQELKTLISLEKPEKDLQAFLFYDIGCNYYYPHEWSDGISWLKHICLVFSQIENKTNN